MKLFKVGIALLSVLLICACSETKYVPEDRYLLDRVKVENCSDEPINNQQMLAYIVDKGNAQLLGSVKIPLRTYSLSGRDSTKWLNRVLRSIGQEPHLYDSLSTYRSMNNLQLQLQNMGYLQATVDVQNEMSGKKLTTTYRLHPGPLYTLRNYHYDIQDSTVTQVLLGADKQQALRKGMAFNVDNLDNERKRITDYLTNRGYYRFNKDYIGYEADSVAGSTEIDLTLLLRRYHVNNDSLTTHPVYRIGKVTYHSGNVGDSIIPLRHKVLLNNTFLNEGDLYSAKELQNTYVHFSRLGIVRYTNITFTERPEEKLLDCDINLSTNKTSTISFQPEGTNTAGDLGAAVALTYQNRNLFRGSENLSIEVRGAYEAIKGLEGYNNDNFMEYSVGARLDFPRFIVPFLSKNFRRRHLATSEVAVMYDRQNRPEFYRRVFTVGWRYKWSDPKHHDRYQVDALDINFISMPWISETFRREYLDNTTSRNSILRYNYEDLFIMRSGLGYTYNNGRWAIKAHVETAGNLLNLMSKIFRFHKNSYGQYTVLDLAYAQYARGNFDYTRNLQLNVNHQLVFHVGLGIAYPYGNSTILPFEKRFFSGGANSVRGWSVRSLGPGKFKGTDGKIDFINQSGDMKLDVNLEYRAKLFWKFSGALFVDAGNIWTLRSYKEQPGGQFEFSSLLEEIAVSYGLGLRLNFDYFIIRFDMGMKAINPAYDTTYDHFPVYHPNLKRDFAFHFAVGLPF